MLLLVEANEIYWKNLSSNAWEANVYFEKSDHKKISNWPEAEKSYRADVKILIWHSPAKIMCPVPPQEISSIIKVFSDAKKWVWGLQKLSQHQYTLAYINNLLLL